MTKRIDGDHLEQLLSQSPRLRREINRPEIPEGLSIVFQHEEPAYLFVTDRIGETTRVYRLAEGPGGPAVAHEESRGRDGKQFNVNLWTGHLVGGRLEYQGEDEFVAMLLCHLSFYRLAREERLPTDT